METVSDLFNSLGFGKHSAIKADTLYNIYYSQNLKIPYSQSPKVSIPLDAFKRKLRKLSSEARHQGTRIIGDDSGYYIAINNEEWFEYKRMRFASIKAELESFANCERLTVRDLIKEVYLINVENPSYELNLK